MSTVLSTREVAALFSVTETTIKRWADGGTMPCVRTMGGHRKFVMKDLMKFAEERHIAITGSLAPAPAGKKHELLEFAVQTRNYRKISEIFLDDLLEGQKERAFDLLLYLTKHHIAFSTIGDEVVRPALVRIGELWGEGSLEVNQEHLASQSAVEALVRLGPELHRKPSHGMSAVCASVEGDYHEIGLRILSTVLECEGWRVHFMGANTPFDTLRSFVRTMKPELVCLSYTLPKYRKELFDEMRTTGKLARSYGAVFLVGGFYAGDRSAEEFHCDHLASSSGDAVAFIKDRFQLRPGPRTRRSAAAR